MDAMGFQTVFQRCEMKYLLTQSQKQAVLEAMKPYMTLDRYGRTTIRSIYYDTDTFLLIRRSMEGKTYKEKLRVRSYAQATEDSPVFVELKKKYKGVVYKRRVSLPEGEAMEWLRGQNRQTGNQIAREIDYVLSFYTPLRPVVFLSYEREAYHCGDGSDFRVTFDDTILGRREELSLQAPVYGTPLLPEGMVLMELKCSGGVPLWMATALAAQRLYRTSFSKYATAYRKICSEHRKEITNNA